MHLFEAMTKVLKKGDSTNFFFATDELVGIVVADTLQTRIFVDEFLPQYSGFFYFGNITDTRVKRLDLLPFVTFLHQHPNSKWYTSNPKFNKTHIVERHH